MKIKKLFTIFLSVGLGFVSFAYAGTNQTKFEGPFVPKVIPQYNIKYFLDEVKYSQEFYTKGIEENIKVDFIYKTHMKKSLAKILLIIEKLQFNNNTCHFIKDDLKQENNLYILKESFECKLNNYNKKGLLILNANLLNRGKNRGLSYPPFFLRKFHQMNNLKNINKTRKDIFLLK